MIEGDYAALEHDQHVGPVLHAALVLLMQLVALHEPKTSDAQGSP